MSQTKAQLISDLVQALAFTATASAPTNGMFLSATNELAISTNSSQRLTVDSSGNVGIGTTTVNNLNKLHLQAASASLPSTSNQSVLLVENNNNSWVTIGSPASNYSGILFADPDDADVGQVRYNHNGNSLEFIVNAQERLRIDSSGNVGIGSSSPSRVLHIKASSANTAHIALIDNDSSNEIWQVGNQSDGDGFMTLRTDEGTTSVLLDASGTNYINSGNVGIGTTSPSYQLDVQDVINIKKDGSNLAKLQFNGTSTRIQYSDTSGNLEFYTNSAKRGHWGYTGGFVVSSGGLTLSGGNITFSGADRSIINNDANALAFGTNSSERMRLDSSGRLLVGTSTARATGGSQNRYLQVEGTSFATAGLSLTCNSTSNSAGLALGRSRGTSVGSSTVVQDGDDLGFISWSGADGTDVANYGAWIFGQVDGTPGSNDMPGRLIFSTNAGGGGNPTERLRIDSSGRLLVGTTSSSGQAILAIQGQISNSAAGAILNIQRGEAASSIASGEGIGNIAFSDNANKTFASINVQADGTAGTNDFPGRILFQTTADGASSVTERMRIDSSGFVGIGESSPGSYDSGARNLVVGSSSNTGILIKAGTSSYSNIYFGDGTGAASYRGYVVYNHNGDSLRLGTTGTERMRIDSSGRVGVNCTPFAQFHVKTGTNANIIMTTMSSEAAIETFNDAGNANVPFRLRATEHKFFISGTERMRIDSSGRVGIGVTSMVARFEVHTTANTQQPVIINDTNNTNSQTHRIGFRTGGTEVGKIIADRSSVLYQSNSDYRLKENIVNIADGITRVKQLQPRRFNFIADAGLTVDGFLAHEAQTVVPEAVTGTHNEVDDNNNPVYQGIDQSKLVPLLTAALQEAIAKIETLETKVAALEAE